MPNLDENIVVELLDRKVVTDTFRRLPGEKKRRLYESAIELFGKYGYDGLAVDVYCEQAGISKGSFFQYFPSKIHLLEMAVLLFDSHLTQLVHEIEETEPGPLARQRLAHLFHRFLADSILTPAEEQFYLFATTASRHATIELANLDLERHLTSYIAEIVKRGQTTGELSDSLNSTWIAKLVAKMLGGVLAESSYADEHWLHDGADFLSAVLFDGIKS